MKAVFKSFTQNKIKLIGVCLLLLSTVVLVLPDLGWLRIHLKETFGFFGINHLLSLAFTIVLIVDGIANWKWRFWLMPVEYTIILLQLYLVGAFSLNREVGVFQESVGWIQGYLPLLSLSLVLLTYRSQLPAGFNRFLQWITGSGMLLYLYYAIYLIPLYPVSAIAGIGLGIAWHTFTPLLFLGFGIVFFLKMQRENRSTWICWGAGNLVAVLVLVGYVWIWGDMLTNLNYQNNRLTMEEPALPVWAEISKTLPRNAMTERLLKSELVYSVPDAERFWNWGIPDHSFDEIRKHDPLVMIAALFRGTPDLDRPQKIQMLKTLYDSRHHAQSRLWSGDQLETVNLISNIRIYPDYRLAYTEKMLSVRNYSTRGWRNTQEAIYTFHLPEGSVVTSLSLWVNGKEEKARLTTKGKADSAYKQIVGVEMRDPSLIHWQEGNTVSVRVFPCTRKENRKFKLGITTPLKFNAGRLTYSNIYFDGPDASGATETVQLQFMTDPLNAQLPHGFPLDGRSVYCEKRYDPAWECSFDAPPLNTTCFGFDGFHYGLSRYTPQQVGFDAKAVYLDINESWSTPALEEVWKLVQHKPVYTYSGEAWVRLSRDNFSAVTAGLQREHFSLFPFHLLPDPQQALVITSSTAVSPNFDEIAESRFGKALSGFLTQQQKVNVFCMDGAVSPYLKTLLELRAFNWVQGDLQALSGFLSTRSFPTDPENDSTIVVHESGVLIHKFAGAVNTKAPDHLLRLFNYNHIMHHAARGYVNKAYINDQLIAEASQAYVVTPLSSLIVLEAQEDYDQHGIVESTNSLQNASMKSSGAVPEPHEWTLIVIALLTMCLLWFKAKG